MPVEVSLSLETLRKVETARLLLREHQAVRSAKTWGVAWNARNRALDAIAEDVFLTHPGPQPGR